MAVSQLQPFNKVLAWTPSNSLNFPTNLNNGFCDAVTVESAGFLSVVLEDNSTVVMGISQGQWIPLRAKRINSTGTTATSPTVYFMV